MVAVECRIGWYCVEDGEKKAVVAFRREDEHGRNELRDLLGRCCTILYKVGMYGTTLYLYHSSL